MALQEQIIHLPFQGGIVEGTHAYLVEPPGLLGVTNGVYTKEGSITKRQGYLRLGQTARSNYRRVATRGDELLSIDPDFLYSYSPTVGEWVLRDRVAEPVCTRADVVNVTTTAKAYDSAAGSGFYVDAWISSADGHVYCAVYDAASGALIGPLRLNAASGTYLSVRVAIMGTTAIVAYSTSASILYQSIALSPLGTFSGELAFASGLSNSGSFGLTTTTTNTWICWGASSTTVRVQRYDTSLSLLNGQTVTLTGGPYTFGFTLAMAVVGTDVFVAVGVQDVLGFALNATTLATSLVQTTILTEGASPGILPRLAVAACTPTRAMFSASYTMLKWRQATTAGAVGPMRTQSAALLASVPFVANGRTYVLGITNQSGNKTIVLLDMAQDDTSTGAIVGRPVGVLAPRQAAYTSGAAAAAPAVTPISSTQWVTLGAISGPGRTGMARLSFDFSGVRGWMPSELAQELYLSGGVTCQYDGDKLVECGFIQAPGVVTSTAGGNIAAGTYQYKVFYEWIDSLGRTHRSQPSATVQVTLGVNSQVTLTISGLSLTLREEGDALAGYPTPIYVVVYRTKAGPGLTFQRVPDAYATAVTNSTVNSVTFIDNLPDSSLVGALHPFAYTDSGTYENVCPPGFTHVCVHQSRIWGIGDDELTIWFSEEFSPPDTPAFHDEFTLLMPERIVALASQDDRLVLFGETSIYVITGTGPASNGAGGSYNVPQRVTSDVGCGDARSVVTCPAGILFQSAARGIMLLDRSLNLNWISQDIQVSQSATPTITSATLVPGAHQVRFTCEKIDPIFGNTFRQLVWDYERNRWSRWEIGPTWQISSACIWNGTYVIILPTASSFAYQEASGSFRDDATWVPLRVETPNIHLGGFSGFQRVWRIMPLIERASNHGLTMSLAYDDGTSYTVSESWSDAQLIGLAPEQIRYAPARQKCQSLRIKLEDFDSGSGTGQGPIYVGMLLKAGILPGETQWIGTANKR